MDNSRMLSQLSFPSAVSTPSPRNIQLSEDGQLFILARNAIHILTPEFNVNSSLFSFFNPQTAGFAKWHINRIQIDKVLHHNWALESDDWGTLSLGSLDVSWIGMALSPTNASKTYCCVVAALTSNLEVSLWSPFKNHISGEWQKIQDVTQIIKDTRPSDDAHLLDVSTAQVHCMAWSKGFQIISSEYTFDGSMLALGNRAGSIVCMKHSREIGLSYITAIRVADDWILNMVWSSWFRKDDGCYIAFIFCSAADGSVHQIQVEVSLESHELKTQFSHTFECLHPSDSTPATALSLIQNKNHDPVLVYTKPGVVHLQRIPQHLQLGWDGSVALALPIQPFLRKQDSLAAVAGIIYYDSGDFIQIHASDGTVYKISEVIESPKLSADPKLLDLSDEIQNFSFFKEELEKVGVDDRICISGVVDYDHTGTLGWFYECQQPNNFSYKLDSQHISYFGLVHFPVSGALPCEKLLNCERVAYGSPTFKLRGPIVYLGYSLLKDSEVESIWELLQKPLPEFPSAQFPTDSQISLFLKLFQDPKYSLLRSRFTLANTFLLVRSSVNPSSVQQYLDRLAQSINCLYMQDILQHFQFKTSRRGDDLDFLLRWLILCHSKGDLLQQEAIRIQAVIGTREDIFSNNAQYCESCPACRVIIPISSEDEIVCMNGHRWERCSITLFILATPTVRTCVGCRRKSLLPRSLKLSSDTEGQDWLPSGSRSEIMNELLEAVHWCIYCGNRFVRFL